MKSKTLTIFWGIILVLGGVFFLFRNIGYFSEIPGGVWKFIFAGASLLFLATWLANGVRNWGWLVPACVAGGLSITILMDEIGGFGSASATPLLASIALPFLVAFAISPQKNRWALIPGWVMFVISLITLFSNRVDGNYIGSFVLFSIGLPFFVVYLLNRSHWWALIPACVMTVIGTFPILSTLFTGDAMGVVVMLMFGLGFLVVFLLTKRNWWALIPAGVFTSIALVVLLVTFKIGANGDQNGLLTGVLLAGIGTTFGILWLMRHNQPTFWAKYPVLGLYVAALLALFTGERFKLFWPIVLIILGLALLLSYLFRKPEKVQENPQKPSEEL
jgi:hypothetical protein